MPALQRKADSLDADSTHDTQRLEELQADYALLEHELQVSLTAASVTVHILAFCQAYLHSHNMVAITLF